MTKTEKSILTIWFLINMMIGLYIVRDFGISYDEPEYFIYAQNSVDAYSSFFALAYMPEFGPHDLPNYGPAFILLPELAIRVIRWIMPNIFAVDIWHFSYFLIFQLGGVCLYALARRWFSMWSSWGILLLYTSQPLLWGHAFINPKDIPFMSFSLFTIWSGFRLADSFGARNTEVSADLFKLKSHSLPRFTVKESVPFLRSPQLLLAGTLLGMTMSIRLLGPLPGMIVILYLALTLRRKALPIIAAYLICATIVMFLTWPYLWPSPLDHWMDSLELMRNFPWPGKVLFNGTYYFPDDLPISYLPTLLNLQLTESLLLLIYLGLIALGVTLFRKRLQLGLFLVTVIGGLLPLTTLIATSATMYDNFRQILFLLPPIILVTGLVFDAIFVRIKPTLLRVLFLIVLASPGIYSIVQLHPYQYVYYNSFIGGTGGAFRRFELDYWCITYREAALWFNEHAPTNANAGGDGPAYLLLPYLRPDLEKSPDEPDDYFVVTSRYNQDLNLYPEAKVVHSIMRDGSALAVIKQITP